MAQRKEESHAQIMEVFVMRKKMIAGNWKMNVTPSKAKELVEMLEPSIDIPEADVVLCVPAIDIVPVSEIVKGTNIKVGAENMFYEEKGAYTGELSAEMLTDAGVNYVILGHSERREYFFEDNFTVNKKIKKAIEHNITPIACCGETLGQRECNVTLNVIRKQISEMFTDIEAFDAADCIIAYEPIWAIGTGKVASAEQAQEVCHAIREVIRELYDDATADKIRVLYGGSMNEANAMSLLSQPDIDGGLIGGASLKMEFARIVKSATANIAV